MKRKSLLITSIVFLILLAVGGAVWYGNKTGEISKESQKHPIETEGRNKTSPAPKESPEATIDTSDWTEYQAKDLGISFRLPNNWEPNEYWNIFPKGESAGWIGIGEHSWPLSLSDKVKYQKLTVAQAIRDRGLVYDDGYNFTLTRNTFIEVSFPLGTGVKYQKMIEPFRGNSPSDSIMKNMQNRELFLIFSEKTKKTYYFQYGYDDGFYDPAIDQIFQEIVKSARPLPDTPVATNAWKVIRGDDPQWQNNQKDWVNISFQIPNNAEVKEIFIADSDDFHRFQVNFSIGSIPVSMDVLPLSSVSSKDGDVSAIASAFKDVEFGGFSEEFSHPYHKIGFANMTGIEFDPIRQAFESYDNEYRRVYTLIKTRINVKPDQYSIYSFSVSYPTNMSDQQKQEVRKVFNQILNTVQGL